MEKLCKVELHTDFDLGVNIDLIDPETYVSPENVALQPEDQTLLQEEDTKGKNDSKLLVFDSYVIFGQPVFLKFFITFDVGVIVKINESGKSVRLFITKKLHFSGPRSIYLRISNSTVHQRPERSRKSVPESKIVSKTTKFTKIARLKLR